MEVLLVLKVINWPNKVQFHDFVSTIKIENSTSKFEGNLKECLGFTIRNLRTLTNPQESGNKTERREYLQPVLLIIYHRPGRICTEIYFYYFHDKTPVRPESQVIS